MNILKFQLGSLQANCYLITEGSDCIIIDPADQGSFLLEEISRRRLNLVGLLATHGHFDHVMAAGEIQASFNIPLYIFEKDIFLIDRLKETARHFLGYEPAIMKPSKTEFLNEGKFDIGGFSFEVIKTPGHTPGSVCFYFKKDSVLFTGDTLFKDAIGRFDFSYCDKNELKKSLEKIFKLPASTRVLPGHEEETTVADQIKNSALFFDYLK